MPENCDLTLTVWNPIISLVFKGLCFHAFVFTSNPLSGEKTLDTPGVFGAHEVEKLPQLQFLHPVNVPGAESRGQVTKTPEGIGSKGGKQWRRNRVLMGLLGSTALSIQPVNV